MLGKRASTVPQCTFKGSETSTDMALKTPAIVLPCCPAGANDGIPNLRRVGPKDCAPARGAMGGF